MMNHTDSGLLKPEEASGTCIKHEQIRLENQLDATCFVTVYLTIFSSCDHGLGLRRES